MDGGKPKPLEWVGSSRSDLREFPDKVQDHIGFALYQAQIGLKHRDAKPLAGLGSGMMEVISDFEAGTYRAVYAVKFREAVYVLHAFQKKSKKGIATPRPDIDLIRRRLKAAERHYEAEYGKGSKR